MTDLKCSVETCCFHDGDCCCRNDIMVGGAKACSCDETCCENFEQQKEGSARNADGYPDRMTQIDCEAVKCRYNTNYKCQAEHVDMRGSRAGDRTKRTLPCCALVGAVGWFVYELAVLYGADAAAASLIAVIPLSLAARICAVLLKTPVTVFLLTGIFPLVPGAGIYYTAYYFIQGENALSLANGISTFKVAVALAVGIALVLGLPMPSGHAWKRK